jgi:hypothetical protein
MMMVLHFQLIQVFQVLVQLVLVLFVQINYSTKYYVRATNQFHLMVQLFVVSEENQRFIFQVLQDYYFTFFNSRSRASRISPFHL